MIDKSQPSFQGEARYIDPTVDCVFRTLFGSNKNKALLLNFLNSIMGLKGDQQLKSLEIIDPYNMKTYLEDKQGIVDVKVTDARGRVFQIEIQNNVVNSLPSRMIHGQAKICASGLESGEDYPELKPTVSIWLLSQNLYPPEKTQRAHLRYFWHCLEADLTLCRENAIHVVQLKNGENDDTISAELALWIRFFRQGKHINLKDPPEWVRNAPIMGEAVNVLSAISEDRRQYLIYDSQEKARRESLEFQREVAERLKKALDSAKERADGERQRADGERQRADQAELHLLAEKQRADEEKQRANKAEAELLRMQRLLADSD